MKPLEDMLVFHKLKLYGEGRLFLVVFTDFFQFCIKNINFSKFFRTLLWLLFQPEQETLK